MASWFCVCGWPPKSSRVLHPAQSPCTLATRTHYAINASNASFASGESALLIYCFTDTNSGRTDRQTDREREREKLRTENQWVKRKLCTHVGDHGHVEGSGDPAFVGARLLRPDVGGYPVRQQQDGLLDALRLLPVRLSQQEGQRVIGQHVRVAVHLLQSVGQRPGDASSGPFVELPVRVEPHR